MNLIITKILWDGTKYTFEENERGSLLRPLECQHYPIFITQPLVPLFYFSSGGKVLL